MEKKFNFPIEGLHLATGYILIVSGICAYFVEGFGMLLSWAIFGCMYISMSDIGESSKSKNELYSFRHKNRRIIAYTGLILSLLLFGYYISHILGFSF